MKLTLKITKPTRRCRCHTPGCRNRDAYKITRRNDVNGNPLYMCADCIEKTAAALDELKAAEKAKKQAIDEQIEAETKARIEAKTAGGEENSENQPADDNAEVTEVEPQAEEAVAPTESAETQPQKKPAKPRSAKENGGKA